MSSYQAELQSSRSDMFRAQQEAKEAGLKLSKLEAVATKLRDTQEAAARELVEAQTKLREVNGQLDKAKDKAAHYRYDLFHMARKTCSSMAVARFHLTGL